MKRNRLIISGWSSKHRFTCVCNVSWSVVGIGKGRSVSLNPPNGTRQNKASISIPSFHRLAAVSKQTTPHLLQIIRIYLRVECLAIKNLDIFFTSACFTLWIISARPGEIDSNYNVVSILMFPFILSLRGHNNIALFTVTMSDFSNCRVWNEFLLLTRIFERKSVQEARSAGTFVEFTVHDFISDGCARKKEACHAIYQRKLVDSGNLICPGMNILSDLLRNEYNVSHHRLNSVWKSFNLSDLSPYRRTTCRAPSWDIRASICFAAELKNWCRESPTRKIAYGTPFNNILFVLIGIRKPNLSPFC